MLPDSMLDIPNWVIETASIATDGRHRIVYTFKSKFNSIPTVTASVSDSSELLTGNASVHIISVTKNEVDISISSNVPGLSIQLHALGK